MNKAQISKLETILGKLESLQNEVKDREIKDDLDNGKSDLIRALRTAEEKLAQ